MKRGGMFGPTECGKTTLAIHLSREYWRIHRVPSLVLDPYIDKWGPQAWVTNDEAKFWEAVKKRRGDLVIVDEAAATIRRERELIPFFTAIRHNFHKLLVLGHDGTDLLPVMRRQFDRLFLFAQPLDAIKIWQKDLPQMRGLEAAEHLQQYEFLRCEAFGRTKKMKLKLSGKR